jgi:hypothetical protein
MRASGAAPAAIAPLVAEAVGRGIRPPIRLRGSDSRAWVVVEHGPASRARDSLLLDEYGDLWWGRPDGRGSALVTRQCWPEEAPAYVDQIASSMRTFVATAAGRG